MISNIFDKSRYFLIFRLKSRFYENLKKNRYIFLQNFEKRRDYWKFGKIKIVYENLSLYRDFYN